VSQLYFSHIFQPPHILNNPFQFSAWLYNLWCRCAGWSAGWQRPNIFSCPSCWQVQQWLLRQCSAKRA